MRRRWKAMVAVGAVALLVVTLFILPPRDDDLGWIRKYGGTEKVEWSSPKENAMMDPPGTRARYVEFSFTRIPASLLNEIGRRQEVYSRDDGGLYVDERKGTVVVLTVFRPDWSQELKNWVNRLF